MTRTRKLVPATAAILGIAALWFALVTRTPAQVDSTLSQSVPASATAWAKFHYQSASQCAECHTNPSDRRKDSLDLVLLTEYSIWQTYDKHAQAYAVLKGPRGKRIGELLSKEKDAASVLKPETGCLNCHAMHNLIEENKAKGSKETLSLDDGVSCGGCHGPSGAAKASDGWRGAHAEKSWRDNDAKTKFEAGMRDLRDPVIRAELCLSCHVGNAAEGKVVTHAMMAAGHPPLPPIEIATFSHNEPQHWRNASAVPYFEKNKDNEKVVDRYHLKDLGFHQTRIALIGNVVAIRETFKLAEERATFTHAKKEVFWPELAGKDPKDSWPEVAMAHSDCFACHHDLRYPGFRQARGFGYMVPGLESERVIPGRPVIRSWPLAGLAAAATQTDKKLDGLKSKLTAIAQATNVRPFGDPALIQPASKDLVGWCNTLLTDLRSKSLTREKAVALAQALSTMWERTDAAGNKQVPDYESARQTASLLNIVCRDLKLDDAKGKLADLNKMLGAEPDVKRDERVNITLGIVEKLLLAKQPADQPKPNYTPGIDSFKDYLTNISDPDKLKKQTGLANRFLVDLNAGLDSKQFSDALLKDVTIKALQKLSDDEQTELLGDIARYNATAFKAKLKELAPLIK